MTYCGSEDKKVEVDHDI